MCCISAHVHNRGTTVSEKSCNCRKGQSKSLTFIPYRKKLIRLSVFWKSHFLDFSWASIISDRIRFILFILDNISFYQISNIFVLDGFLKIHMIYSMIYHVLTVSVAKSLACLWFFADRNFTFSRPEWCWWQNSSPTSIWLEVGDRFDCRSSTSFGQVSI